jgi:hypothetical protein
MISYTVTCTFSDSSVAEEWIQWLRDEHLAEVCAAGAIDAEVVKFDGARESASSDGESKSVTCEVRYHFASQEEFARYERDHAPRLRARGLELFPPSRGLTYQRRLGEVRVTIHQGGLEPAARPTPAAG